MDTPVDARATPLPPEGPSRSSRRRNRTRRSWVLFALGVLLGAAWAGSAWRGVDFAVGDVRLSVDRGVARLMRGGPVIRTRVSWVTIERSPNVEWWLVGPGGFGVGSFKPSFFGYAYGWLACVALWPPALGCIAAGGWSLWSQRRRRLTGCCANCGYPMAGVERCPECGATR